MTEGFRYDPYGAGTEYEMSVPAWALKPCVECHAQHYIEGHAEGCPRLAEDARIRVLVIGPGKLGP